MFTIIKKIWSALDNSDRDIINEEKFDEQTEELENIINKQENQNLVKPLGTVLETNTETVEPTEYSRRDGIITFLKIDHGIIDNSIFFDISRAYGLASDLHVGCRVRYLAHQEEGETLVKVFKITEILEGNWDDTAPLDENVQKQVEQLKLENPTYFTTHQRNILGLILERLPDSIIIDTDYKLMTINLESVEMSFLPKEGDRVYVCCNVQNDDKFVDQQGEILEEVAVHPTRMLKKQNCYVSQINEGWAVLNDNCYITFDLSPQAAKLVQNDNILADMIECERGNYNWRCINFEVVDSSASEIKPLPKSSETQVIRVTDDMRWVFSAINQTKVLEFDIYNNADRVFRAKSIEFMGKRQTQIKLLKPELANGFDINPREHVTVEFICESLVFGSSREVFILQFDGFRIKRSIHLTVCGSEEEAQEKRQRSVDLPVPMPNGRTNTHRSRFYAHSVWGRKTEVIPGVTLGPRRRFIKYRIGHYEVPARLKSSYLCSQTRNDMYESVETFFPSIKEELTFKNYAARFQTLLHLEEIEYFISFRNYDQERAHFTRDGEFLALLIENLAERRPSLVLGDTVRATSPWDSDEGEARSYDGVIHKVLYNRVLLKFNQGFQSKYNGEDYRLEFYFSRYGFRKQHHATHRAARFLGEHFLFPTKIKMRDHIQLNTSLSKSFDLMVDGQVREWANKDLNEIQKRAVCQILRSEAFNMPYIIFGPPGTGKTVTLIETIIQITKLIPHSRILVGTPSNSSADIIATRLIDSKALEVGDFIRLVSQNLIEKELIPEHLLRYCATVDIGIEGTCENSMITTDSGLKLKCQQKFIGRHKITISTCTTLGNFMQMDFPRDHFTHIIIDEAGQCTEPEVMVAITQVCKPKGQVILAGDPNQLQPIVVNNLANFRGLSRSYLMRVLTHTPYVRDIVRFPETCGYDPRLVTKLLFSYRALPSILNVYNELFYDSELVPMVDELNSRESQLLQHIRSSLPNLSTLPLAHGVFFFGLRSENKQENDSPSWYNPLEAKQVFFRTLRLYRLNIPPEKIGIITPYTKQVKHLRGLFIAADIAMPKIGSVEEFQGQERDVILISTVRSCAKLIPADVRHSLGFVRCPKRMNVAVSRARSLLIVFGNPYLLVHDRSWRSYISYCLDNDAYDGCDLPDNIINGVYEADEEEVFTTIENEITVKKMDVENAYTLDANHRNADDENGKEVTKHSTMNEDKINSEVNKENQIQNSNSDAGSN